MQQKKVTKINFFSKPFWSNFFPVHFFRNIPPELKSPKKFRIFCTSKLAYFERKKNRRLKGTYCTFLTWKYEIHKKKKKGGKLGNTNLVFLFGLRSSSKCMNELVFEKMSNSPLTGEQSSVCLVKKNRPVHQQIFKDPRKKATGHFVER